MHRRSLYFLANSIVSRKSPHLAIGSSAFISQRDRVMLQLELMGLPEGLLEMLS